MKKHGKNRRKQAAVRPKRAPRTAWKPGQSGNPNGRPKVAKEIIALAREKSPEAIARLAELMEDVDGRVAVRACEAILHAARLPSELSDAEQHGVGGGLIINWHPIKSVEDLARLREAEKLEQSQ